MGKKKWGTQSLKNVTEKVLIYWKDVGETPSYQEDRERRIQHSEGKMGLPSTQENVEKTP